jgi:hypothetical protein
MPIARILGCMLVGALATGAFVSGAHAQASGSAPGSVVSTNARPVQVAGLTQRKHGKEMAQRTHGKQLVQRKHGKELVQRKYASKHAKVRAAHIARYKKQRPTNTVAREPVNSILLRVAPYYLTLA